MVVTGWSGSSRSPSLRCLSSVSAKQCRCFRLSLDAVAYPEMLCRCISCQGYAMPLHFHACKRSSTAIQCGSSAIPLLRSVVLTPWQALQCYSDAVLGDACQSLTDALFFASMQSIVCQSYTVALPAALCLRRSYDCFPIALIGLTMPRLLKALPSRNNALPLLVIAFPFRCYEQRCPRFTCGC